MLRLATITIFSICYFSMALAAPNLNFATNAMAQEAPFHLNYSALDLAYAKDLDLLYTELTKNKLRNSSIENLAKYQQKAHSFSILNPTYDRLKKMLAITDQDSFYKNCEIASRNINEYTDNIAERINIAIDSHCRYLFLKRLSSLSSSVNFSSRDLAYFKEAAPFYSSGENQEELVHLLKHFKTNPTEHEKLSNFLIEKYIELKIRPATSILSSLRVNPQFNKFLQNNLNLDNSSNSYFQEEFQRLARMAQENAEKGDTKQAKTMISVAVSFYNNNKSFIDTRKAWQGVIRTGKELFFKGRDSDALDVFALAKSISAKEDISETNFYLIWPHVINKDFSAIKSSIEKYSLEKSFDSFDSKLQFWIAYTFLKSGDTKKSTALFNKIINTSPYSFYSIISLKELATLNKGLLSESEILAKLVSHDDSVEYSIDKISNNLKDSLRRLAAWNALGNERFSVLETRFIQTLSKSDTFKDAEFAKNITPQAHKEFVITNLIRLLHSQKKYIPSFKIFQDSLDQNSLSLNYKLIKFIFPLNYIDLIKKNAETLDPLIVISLIRQESAFNPEAKSGVGAKGLMQLMPATAKRFNKRIRVKHLGNPEINVAIGSKYLRLLLARFDGNLIFALASYNAGESRIDRWRKEIFRNDDPLSTIESIPYEETRNYVKLIYRNNFFYSLLAKKSILMIPLEESFKVDSNQKRF